MRHIKYVFVIGKKHAPNYPSDEDGNNVSTGKCEACGNLVDDQNTKFKKEKRFCSSGCAKRLVNI